MTASAPNPNQFDPPTAERLAAHLAEHPASATPAWRGWLPLVLAGVVAVVLLLAVHPLLAVLPWAAVMVVMGLLAARVHRARALHQRVVRAWELAMLRHHREALRRAWTLLPLLRDQPELSARCVTVLAHTLDELACYDAAIVAIDHLLARLPEPHPMAIQLRVQRANADLCTGHLADADDALRKLRGTIDPLPPGPIPAGYHLARLVQDARTGHFAEAAEHGRDTAEHLRPLGVHAGFGYGLLAYCHHMLALHDPDHKDTGQRRTAARDYWRRATLLIPPAALAHRYHELAGLLATAPDASHPATQRP